MTEEKTNSEFVNGIAQVLNAYQFREESEGSTLAQLGNETSQWVDNYPSF